MLTMLFLFRAASRGILSREYFQLCCVYLRCNGNPTLVTNDLTNITREMYWDEDNRLIALSDNAS